MRWPLSLRAFNEERGLPTPDFGRTRFTPVSSSSRSIRLDRSTQHESASATELSEPRLTMSSSGSGSGLIKSTKCSSQGMRASNYSMDLPAGGRSYCRTATVKAVPASMKLDRPPQVMVGVRQLWSKWAIQ